MKQFLSIVAALLVFYSYVPYARDIMSGKVKPARSARGMLLLLLILAFFQQVSLRSGWLLALSAGELIGSVGILSLALKRGVGGLTRIDLSCYILLLLDLLLWLTTGSALLALHLSMLADVIAMIPVLIKIWRQPWTETRTFFALAIFAPLLNIVAVGDYRYAHIVFLVYISLINLLVVALISYRQSTVPSPHRALSQDHQPLN